MNQIFSQHELEQTHKMSELNGASQTSADHMLLKIRTRLTNQHTLKRLQQGKKKKKEKEIDYFVVASYIPWDLQKLSCTFLTIMYTPTVWVLVPGRWAAWQILIRT